MTVVMLPSVIGALNRYKYINKRVDKAIFSNYKSAYMYYITTRDERDLPRLKDMILNSDDLSYMVKLSNYVIHGRWPEAELKIMKNPEWAYKYALNIIRGSWPEAEPYIAKSGEWSYQYAYGVLAKPFPLGEEAIKKDALDELEKDPDYSEYESQGWIRAHNYYLRLLHGSPDKFSEWLTS